jgi:hypothetical protein
MFHFLIFQPRTDDRASRADLEILLNIQHRLFPMLEYAEVLRFCLRH